MEEVFKYMDNVRAEMEKLQGEYQTKTESLECLKKAHDVLLVKFEEAKQQIEKQACLLDSQSDEISEARLIIKTHTSGLNEKDMTLNHLIYEKEKLLEDCREELHKLEGENKELLLALDEASSENKELKQMLSASNEEITGLKMRLLETETKKKFEESNEFGKIDDVILKLEEGNRNVKEQLKWKQEQFNHLEDAHVELQDEFKLQKEEWEKEKEVLLEEILSLQKTSLNPQIRTVDDLETRLDMCNQDLGFEKSKRKLLEVQVSELEYEFEDVLSQFLGNKSILENSNRETDEQTSLDIEVKDEACLQDSQEAIIWKPGVMLLASFRKKIQDLQHGHSDCFRNINARESRWSTQIEQLKWELKNCECEIERKQQQMQEVQYLHMQENCLIILILQSEFSEAYATLLNEKNRLELLDKENQDKIDLLVSQLEVSNCALMRTYDYLEVYTAEISSFLEKIESLDHAELQSKEALQLHEIAEVKLLGTEVIRQFQNEQKSIESQVKNPENQYEDEVDMLALVEQVCDRMDVFCNEDVKLMDFLEKILQFVEEFRPEMGLKSSDELYNSA